MQIPLKLGEEGHKFMKFIVAFLVVSRVKMSIDRYNEARTNIGILFRESRKLV
jgi:predicted membrane chloride channel (bestrophin family)